MTNLRKRKCSISPDRDEKTKKLILIVCSSSIEYPYGFLNGRHIEPINLSFKHLIISRDRFSFSTFFSFFTHIPSNNPNKSLLFASLILLLFFPASCFSSSLSATILFLCCSTFWVFSSSRIQHSTSLMEWRMFVSKVGD